MESRATGITLTEMVVVMAIVAILLAIAIPSYKYITNSNRVSGEINGLLGDMQFARAEAIKEGQWVTICASADQATCSGNTSWQTGWVVFPDPNNNQTVTSNALNPILRAQAAFTGSDTLIANNNASAVTFNREGFSTTPGVAVLLTLHANGSAADQAATRCLALSIAGSFAVVAAIATQTTGTSFAGSAACL